MTRSFMSLMSDVLLLVGLFFAAAVIIGAPPPLNSGGSDFERTVKTSPGQELTLDLSSGGAVHVRGWDQDTLLVRAHFAHQHEHQTEITLEPKSGGFLLKSHNVSSSPAANHRFEVWVPRKYDLSISSAGGELLISDLEGTFHGELHGGRILMEHTRGHAELFTGGGEVRVTDSELTGSVTTARGVAKSSNVRGDVRISSRARN